MNSISQIFIENPSTGSFLVDIIVWLVKISSSVALGVVLFTVLLKLVTLPFDFISRFSMRKNSIKMEQMRPELEKLQKQYADNKDLYNQKMMALYKKNGYSMMSACLPSIVMIVIFFIAISAFNNYSTYQNVKYFYDCSVSYNSVIYNGLETDDTYIKIEDNQLFVDDLALFNSIIEGDTNTINKNGHNIIVVKNEAGKYIKVKTSNGYVEYQNYYSDDNGNKVFQKNVNAYFEVIPEKIENANLVNSENRTFNEQVAYVNNYNLTAETPLAVPTEKEFLQSICAYKSAETFRNNGSSFLWVKNIWLTDSTSVSPVEYSVFKNNKSSCSACASCNIDYGEISEEKFNILTADLEEEKGEPNGYFILVALTALSSLLMQFISNKSNKAQMELQTVDGQGAQQQKMMMWMLPIMMAIFSFMYTAAFSIYIILSSIISIGTTLGINVLVDSKYKNEKQENQVVRGRVYNKPAETEKKPEKKKDKGEEKPDFLNSKKENRKIFNKNKK